MNEDGPSGVGIPPRKILGFYVFDGMAVGTWGRLRVLLYTPFARENWKIDYVFDADFYQLEIGPIVVGYCRGGDCV